MVSSRLAFTGCLVTHMLWKRPRVLEIGITLGESERVMTIARGEIDSTDRCQPSAEPLIVFRQIPFFYHPGLRCLSLPTSIVHAAETSPPPPLLSPLCRHRH